MHSACDAAHTIVIDPGSYYLKIARAVDAEPIKLLHCIARPLTPVSSINKALNRNESLSETICTNPSLTAKIREIFRVTLNDDEVAAGLSSLPIDIPNCLSNGNSKPDGTRKFYALDDAINLCTDERYQLLWPFRNGFFTQNVGPSAVLQDLEDIWTTAFEKHLSIKPDQFSTYQVVLVIGDVFRRQEVRHLAELLLNRMQFSQLIIQQAAICSSYCLAVSVACIVEVGDQKTSICCLEDGLENSASRVVLFVGRVDVLHALLHLRNSIDGCDWPINSGDMEAMRKRLEHIEDKHLKDLQNLCDSNKMDFNSDSSCDASSPPSLYSLLYATLLPFYKIRSNNDQKPYYELQLPSLETPQPDDPFDDLYMTLTARERRKKAAGATADPTGTDQSGEVKIERDDPDPNQSLPGFDRVDQVRSNLFNNLADAVWWSVCQACNTSCTSTDGSTQTMSNRTAAGDELFRRLLNTVILTGGGCRGFTGLCLRQWLIHELGELVHKHAHSQSVDVISPHDPCDTAWKGARLLLIPESSTDLWISSAEWKKSGSRTIREKAAFVW